MIEETVLNYLTTQLEGTCPVFMETPEKPPQKYVLIEKAGGGIENHVYEASVAILSVAPSLYEAATLNEAVCSAMDDMPAHVNIGRTERSGDYYYPDTARGLYRYQALYDINY